MKFLEHLKLSETRNIKDLDTSSVLILHSQIIQNKTFLRKLYIDFYNEFKKAVETTPDTLLIELGSGSGFIKKIIPNIITSDILDLPNIDKQFTAEKIPFNDDTVDAFFMLNVFHHVKEPLKLLNELNRCLKVGGKVVMIEPANTFWSRFIYKNFHHENFDPDSKWHINGVGPMSSSNSALPWIVFFRDLERFKNEFTTLKIKKVKYHTPFRYIISGGVSFRQFLPSFTYEIIKFVEMVLSPLNKHIGMFYTIEIEKIL